MEPPINWILFCLVSCISALPVIAEMTKKSESINSALGDKMQEVPPIQAINYQEYPEYIPDEQILPNGSLYRHFARNSNIRQNLKNRKNKRHITSDSPIPIIYPDQESFKIKDFTTQNQIRPHSPTYSAYTQKSPLSPQQQQWPTIRFPSPPITSYPTPITSYPTPITSYPTPITSYPTPITSYPTPIPSYPTPISFYPIPIPSYPTPSAHNPPLPLYPPNIPFIPYPILFYPYPVPLNPSYPYGLPYQRIPFLSQSHPYSSPPSTYNQLPSLSSHQANQAANPIYPDSQRPYSVVLSCNNSNSKIVQVPKKSEKTVNVPLQLVLPSSTVSTADPYSIATPIQHKNATTQSTAYDKENDNYDQVKVNDYSNQNKGLGPSVTDDHDPIKEAEYANQIKKQDLHDERLIGPVNHYITEIYDDLDQILGQDPSKPGDYNKNKETDYSNQSKGQNPYETDNYDQFEETENSNQYKGQDLSKPDDYDQNKDKVYSNQNKRHDPYETDQVLKPDIEDEQNRPEEHDITAAPYIAEQTRQEVVHGGKCQGPRTTCSHCSSRLSSLNIDFEDMESFCSMIILKLFIENAPKPAEKAWFGDSATPAITCGNATIVEAVIGNAEEFDIDSVISLSLDGSCKCTTPVKSGSNVFVLASSSSWRKENGKFTELFLDENVSVVSASKTNGEPIRENANLCY